MGWVKPVAAALENLTRPPRVTVFITPCTFASGTEPAVAAEIHGVHQVIGPQATLAFTLLGIKPRGLVDERPKILLFLGGDLAYAVLLARRLRCPAMAYTEGRTAWERHFKRIAVPYGWMAEKALKRGVPAEKIVTIGNLMLDAVDTRLSRNEARRFLDAGDRPVLLLMPGSRLGHFSYMTPFLAMAAEIAASSNPGLLPVISLSPFADTARFLQSIHGADARLLGATLDFLPGGPDGLLGVLRTGRGLKIGVWHGRQYDLMTAADLAVSLPGTNTMELAFMRVPSITVVPLCHPDRIPLEGIPGLLGGLPLFGKLLKRHVLTKALTKVAFTSWPNRLAGEMLVPELKGNITQADLAQTIVELIRDEARRGKIRERLATITGPAGASRRLAAMVENALIEHYAVLSGVKD